MRISVWSSDVCSSDLDDAVAGRVGAGAAAPLRRRVRKSGQCWRLRARGLVAQQLPPALQEQRAVVELDCQQVALAEPLPGKQAVADLRCARAQVIAAVADALQVAVADEIGRAHV